MIYLDYFATTPCDPAVRDAMLPWFTQDFANPHSTHAAGLAAAAAVDEARASVASLIGSDPREIVFTSGATEANNLAIKGTARYRQRTGSERHRVITSAVEHKCVLEAVRSLADEGFEPVILGVDPQGRVDPDALDAALQVPTALVSIMSANNETGVLQDIPRLAALAKRHGAVFHTDLAQKAGKMPVTLENIDLASLSGHKLYGPKGIGALYVRRKPRVRLVPLFSGGGQERGLRSGTLPTPLIVGFGVAARIAEESLEADRAVLSALRERLWNGLRTKIPGLTLNGEGAPRLPGGLNVCLPEGIAALDVIARVPGVALSTGSACSAAELVPSYVLTAMGLTEKEASRCLRLSVGRFTSRTETDHAVVLLTDAVTRSVKR